MVEMEDSSDEEEEEVMGARRGGWEEDEEEKAEEPPPRYQGPPPTPLPPPPPGMVHVRRPKSYPFKYPTWERGYALTTYGARRADDVLKPGVKRMVNGPDSWIPLVSYLAVIPLKKNLCCMCRRPSELDYDRTESFKYMRYMRIDHTNGEIQFTDNYHRDDVLEVLEDFLYNALQKPRRREGVYPPTANADDPKEFLAAIREYKEERSYKGYNVYIEDMSRRARYKL